MNECRRQLICALCLATIVDAYLFLDVSCILGSPIVQEGESRKGQKRKFAEVMCPLIY